MIGEVVWVITNQKYKNKRFKMIQDGYFPGTYISHIVITHENFWETRIDGYSIFSISTQVKKRLWSKKREYKYVQVAIFADMLRPEIKEAIQNSDITYIDVFGSEGQHAEIRVPWEDDAKGLNSLQRTCFSEAGSMFYLEIGEKE